MSHPINSNQPESPDQNKNPIGEQWEEKTNTQEENLTKMEAYHPHEKRHRRNFKDYISEFLMIFVAITGGFFMENIREKTVERHKEKEYIVRLVRDLKEDTTKLRGLIQWNIEQMNGLDSLSKQLEQPVSSINLEKFITYLSQDLNDFHFFTPRDITISQLENTGGLRLIENSDVADSIVMYYNFIESGEGLRNANNQFLEETFKQEMEFLDFNQTSKTGRLVITDANKLKELGNRSFVFKVQIRAYNELLKNISYHCDGLIECLKREYKLKDNEG